MSPKGPPFNFFKNFLQPAGVSQSPKGPSFKFWALDMAPTLAVLGLFPLTLGTNNNWIIFNPVEVIKTTKVQQNYQKIQRILRFIF